VAELTAALQAAPGQAPLAPRQARAAE
jgi:hypothetical protein